MFSQFTLLRLFHCRNLTTHHQTSLTGSGSLPAFEISRGSKISAPTSDSPTSIHSLPTCMQVPGTWFITASWGGAKLRSQKFPWSRKRTMEMKADSESSRKSPCSGKPESGGGLTSSFKILQGQRLDACLSHVEMLFIWHYVLKLWKSVLDWFSCLTLYCLSFNNQDNALW